MGAIRILHCSDLHLGTPPYSRSSLAGGRTQELLNTFKNIISLCKTYQIDLLLIAGDFFDSNSVELDLLRSVKEYLNDCPASIFIAPGNHDYIALDSPYISSDWPDNVHIFKGGLEPVDLRDHPVTVWGAGFTSSYITESFEFHPDSLETDRINICVLHGDLVHEDGKSRYRPIARSALARSGMDYVALGHGHQVNQPIEQAGPTFYAYSGCPDGRGFDEIGPKGVLMGEVSRRSVHLKFLPTSSRQYLIESIDVTDIETEIDAKNLVMKVLEERAGADWQKNFYRVRLTGQFPSEKSYFWDNVQANLEEEAPALRLINETEPVTNYETLAKEASLKGIFVRRMLDRIRHSTQSEEDVFRLALRYGIRAFEGEVNPYDY